MSMSKQVGGLGFRHLESFNQALLPKQCWRLMIGPDSLVARALKEKYFKTFDLLNAKLVARPSMIWMSLWGVLKLLKEGLVWRVGNWQNIRIWGNKWIPRPYTYCLQSPINFFNKNATVSKLIDAEKRELVSQVLMVDEAEQVCNISLSFSGAVDKQIWGHIKNGLFTIRGR